MSTSKLFIKEYKYKEKPDEYLLSSNETHTIKEFIESTYPDFTASGLIMDNVRCKDIVIFFQNYLKYNHLLI